MPNVSLRSSYNWFKLIGTTKGNIYGVGFNPQKPLEKFSFGKFHEIVGTKSTFSGGDMCDGDGNKSSKLTIEWIKCGTKFGVTFSDEVSPCNYLFKAIMPCCAVDDPTAWDPNAAPAGI